MHAVDRAKHNYAMHVLTHSIDNNYVLIYIMYLITLVVQQELQHKYTLHAKPKLCSLNNSMPLSYSDVDAKGRAT